MTREEAQFTLLRYRPGTLDATDPEITEALELAKDDADLSRWLEKQCAQQEILRAKIRQIPVPVALKEQIIFERPRTPSVAPRRAFTLAAACALMMLIFWSGYEAWQHSPADDTFTNYRRRIVSTALRGYGMAFESADREKIRSFLANKKIQNYELPGGLQKAEAVGCAIEDWQGTNVAMICFRTGAPLQPGDKSDLWLFVVDQSAVKRAPDDAAPQFARVNKLTTATWTRDGKLYLLGTYGEEQSLRRWL